MEFIDLFAAGCLMQAVNVLGDNSQELAFLFPLGELQVRLVGLGVERQHLIPVETEESFWLLHKEGMGQDGFRRVIILLIIESVYAAEIRDTAFRGNAGTAEEDDSMGIGDHLLKGVIWHKAASFLGINEY